MSINPTEPGSHKPYMDRSLFGCLAGHYNAIGTELEVSTGPVADLSSIPAAHNYSSRSHFHQDMMEVRTFPTNWGTAQPDRTDVPLLAVTATATEKVNETKYHNPLWSWLVIQLGDMSYDGQHRSYNRVVEMFTSSTTDATKERISK
ncbi:hypothetical protein DPMN_002081 [Dreissena polymorpha]|uniref:Uncharacterized protein n=1 Tax=Dreissena polymorpha TaxID=45954 RepID=A0A9D4MJ05_DREPO|nr:hypothetical protein DPMN_002081 [Dreissena polymorpha]